MYENETCTVGTPEPCEMNKEYKPTKAQLLREYEVGIKFLSRGCVVRVGCKEIAFTSIDEAMLELNNYIRDPHASTEKWNRIFNQ